MKKRGSLPRKVKSTYRKTRARTSPVTVIIIVLLVLLVLTLSYLLLKDKINNLIETPEQTETTEAQTDVQTTPQTTADSFDTSTYVKATDEVSVNRGSLILVDRQYPYIFSAEDKYVSLFADSTTAHFSLASSTLSLKSEAYKALRAMTDDYFAATSDESLMVTSAFRTSAEQREYYDYWVTNPEEDAPYYELPDYSDHHTGLAFDVKIYTSAGISYKYADNSLAMMNWIVTNHAKYGFIMRYPSTKAEFTGITSEGNHFRYVGVPHAEYMEANDLCLEEYITLLKSYTLKTEPLTVVISSGEYMIYYVAQGEELLVPPASEYTISGNNTDGFIVTVKTK